MSELNREQIIKALECCASGNSVSACMSGCPLYEKEDCECIYDETALLKYALVLIKELTEENKVRKGLNTMIGNELRRLGKENERLTEELAKSYKALDEQMNFYCSFTKSKVSDCPINDEIAKAKADTAREIFEEIGKLTNEYLQGKIYTHEFCTNLAELKKKYTEEGA